MKWNDLRLKIEALVATSNPEFGAFGYEAAFSLLVRERFITRSAHSVFKDSIILKGGLLLTMLYSKSTRYTGDIDIGLRNVHELSDYQKAVDAILAVDLGDGFQFTRNDGAILSSPAREYDGAQFNITCVIEGKQRSQFILDIGVGDDVQPAKARLPTLAEFTATSVEMQVYPPETIAAEKYHAIVLFKARNTRFKDFYDLYILMEQVEPDKFKAAAKRTFLRRKTEFSEDFPLELRTIQRMQTDWERFLGSKQYRVIKKVPTNFQEVVTAIFNFYIGITTE